MAEFHSFVFLVLWAVVYCDSPHKDQGGGELNNFTYPRDAPQAFYKEGVQADEDDTYHSHEAAYGDNYTKFSGGANRKWSAWFGGKGTNGVKKVCPRGRFITRFTVHTSFWLFGNHRVIKIGQVLCSNGDKLPCCDGQEGLFDHIETFKKETGFRKVFGMHQPTKLTTLCFEGGKCEGSSFEVDCGRGFKLAGYQVRGSIAGIRFLCRRHRQARPQRCGTLHPVSEKLCPNSYSLPACYDGPVNAYCLATGQCYEDTQLQNCRGRSVYLKL